MKKIKDLFSTPLKGAVVIICAIFLISLIAFIAFMLSHSGSTINAIGAEKAENLALVDAGVDPAKANMDKTDYSYKNGKFVYEVEFEANGTEYDYHIDAQTGAVVKKKQEPDDDYITRSQNTNDVTQPASAKDKEKTSVPKETQSHNKTQQSADTDNDIGVDRAKEIALEKSGFTADEVTLKKAKLDHDGGYNLYKIEFIHGDTEYEYLIHAADGSVIKFDTDKIHQ